MVFRRKLRPSDVFLVGHPKSGNTWLAYMLAVLLHPRSRDEINLYNIGDYVPFVHGREDRIRRWEHLPNPRVFRNESPQHWDLYPRTLYLIRDPRAVLLSFWHMYRTMFDDRNLGLADFVDRYMSKNSPFDRWNKHLVRWDAQVQRALDALLRGAPEEQERKSQRLLIVRYEDLVAAREDTFSGVAEFVSGGRPHAVGVERAVEAGELESMRNLEDLHGAEAYAGRARGEGRFVRRGLIDGWKDEMEPAVSDRIVSELGPVMERMGYAC